MPLRRELAVLARLLGVAPYECTLLGEAIATALSPGPTSTGGDRRLGLAGWLREEAPLLCRPEACPKAGAEAGRKALGLSPQVSSLRWTSPRCAVSSSPLSRAASSSDVVT